MALNPNRILMMALVSTLMATWTLAKISKTKSILHEHSKIENASPRLTQMLKERRLLGRFSGSKLIHRNKSKLAIKKVKNLKSTGGLPPGRKLAAVYTKKVATTRKASRVSAKPSDVERQLRKKGKWAD